MHDSFSTVHTLPHQHTTLSGQHTYTSFDTGPLLEDIKKELIRFDYKILQWIFYCCLLVLFSLFSIFSMLIFIKTGTHYLVAVSFAAFLFSLLCLYSLSIYCRDEEIELADYIESYIIDKIDTAGIDKDSDKGEILVKSAMQAKNRWNHVLQSKTTWTHTILYYTCYRIIRLYLWIPYALLAEQLLHAAKQCYIRGIREKPKSMELHAGLANTYVTLSNHLKESYVLRYTLPLKGRGIFYKFISGFKMKYEHASRRAIQELLILQSFAPDELWVLDQLAISFRELGMVDQEVEIYETILRNYVDDTNAIFRLGLLSFLRGNNATGLQMYDTLLYLQPLLAQELITSFGAYDCKELCEKKQKKEEQEV